MDSKQETALLTSTGDPDAASDDKDDTLVKMATSEPVTGGTEMSIDSTTHAPDQPASDGNGLTVEVNGQEDQSNRLSGSQGEVTADHEPEDRCEDDANFAAVCSFFLKFGHALGISYSIDDLKIMLEDHDHGEFISPVLLLLMFVTVIHPRHHLQYTRN